MGCSDVCVFRVLTLKIVASEMPLSTFIEQNLTFFHHIFEASLWDKAASDCLGQYHVAVQQANMITNDMGVCETQYVAGNLTT